MKIVIDLPEWYIKETEEFKHPNFVDKAIADGKPLSEVLDDLSAEMIRLDEENWELSVTDILGVIDRYGKEAANES